ncbi:MAG TPA: trypsin-like peptidase domain-containing protein [Acidimicrobiales bacterium]|nr:trypsin-like peptidase domain-containing protein [Acidimicrobiales bacterium]
MGDGWNTHEQSDRRSRKGRIPLALAAALLVIAVGLGTFVGHGLWPSKSAAAALQSVSSGSAAASGASASVASVAQKVDPAIVDINVTFSYQSAQGAGTGIVLTPNGEILTNNHVIEGATSIQVTDVGNGRTYSATVVGYESSADIAVLQLSGASGLATAKFGDSSALQNGQTVVAIGNAGGVGGTPSSSAGTVTGLDRSITASDQLSGTEEQLSGLIETNAGIQSGDSGGALTNTAGQVLGMITAGSATDSFGAGGTGQGYAIPINLATSVAKQIEKGQSGTTVHVGPTAFLGVLISASDQSTASGAAIGGVVSGGPAAQAGLSAGDTITSIAGSPVTSASALSTALSPLSPGTTVRVGWTDANGQAHVTSVQLATGPAA